MTPTPETLAREAVALYENARAQWLKDPRTPRPYPSAPYIVAQALLAAAERERGLRRVGAILSNCAYNLAQHEGRALTKDECRSLDEARRAWDAALAATSTEGGGTR